MTTHGLKTPPTLVSSAAWFSQRTLSLGKPIRLFYHRYKANLSRVQGQVNTQNDITSILGTLVGGWQKVTQSYMTEIFSGSDGGLTQLDAYIIGGKWSDPSFSNSLFDLQGIMENVLYGSLIPQAWLDHTKVNPVIVFQGAADITNPLTTILESDDTRTLSNAVSP